jgi:hypothetical protein
LASFVAVIASCHFFSASFWVLSVCLTASSSLFTVVINCPCLRATLASADFFFSETSGSMTISNFGINCPNPVLISHGIAFISSFMRLPS